MEEVKNINLPKTKNCIVCGSLFVYQRTTSQYCSNACKCKAYQTRQLNEQSITRVKNNVSRHKQKNRSDEIINGPNTMIGNLKKTIIEQRQYIEHLHRQFDQFCDKVTNEFSKTKTYYESVIDENKKIIDELRNENNQLKRNILSNENSIIASGIGALLNTTVKK